MLLRLMRRAAEGDAIPGQLTIDGHPFCNTLERKGVEILALWYTVSVTQSPRFQRLLPIVNSVPGRTGIRFHTGTLPRHSKGCILVPTRELENQLTQTLLHAQQKHETIYLEISDYAPAAPLYDVPCPATERMRHLEVDRIRQEYYRLHPDERKAG